METIEIKCELLLKSCNTLNNPYIESLLLNVFLIEEKNDGFFLSADSFNEKCCKFDPMFIFTFPDAEYLRNFLYTNRFGYLDTSYKILLNKGIDLNKFRTKLFKDSLPIPYELGYSIIRSKFEYFCKYSRSFRVPVLTLEPFIARLVQAFLLIGVPTCSSCNRLGYYSKNIYVAFIIIFSFLWAKNLFKNVIEPLVFTNNIKYQFDNTYFQINQPSVDNYIANYDTIHKIADTIIKNKNNLLDINKDTIFQST